MSTDYNHIIHLVALLKEHEVQKIVLCPDNKNQVLSNYLKSNSFFSCHTLTDERNAAFFANGLALQSGQPVAICCSDGNALRNMHPAIAEAYIRQIPLIVVSMGNNTMQSELKVKTSVNLQPFADDNNLTRIDTLINEAITETNHHGKGPVHIHIPISDSDFKLSETALPIVRTITRYQGLNAYDRSYDELIARLNKYSRRMIVVGQMNVIYQFNKSITKQLYKHFAWLKEHTGNKTIPGIPISNFDSILRMAPEKTQQKMSPDLVITYGKQLFSEQLSTLFRQFPPKEHWHVSLDGEIFDPFGLLTTVIEMDPFEFLEKIALMMDNDKTEMFPRLWENTAKAIVPPTCDFSSIKAVGQLMNCLPHPSALHLANGIAIQYAQLFSLAEDIEVCSNLNDGGNGGILPTAIGYAAASNEINIVILSDKDFFHDMNVLCCSDMGGNLRIMLLNTGSFSSAKDWAVVRGFRYMSVQNDGELTNAVASLTDPQPATSPLLVEIFSDADNDFKSLNDYFSNQK